MAATTEPQTASPPAAVPDAPGGGDDRAGGAEGAPSLTHSTARGMAWYTAQTLVFKGASVVGQLVLAYLLTPDAAGLILMIGIVSLFAGMIQSAGIREVLIRRHARFERWANPAFWLSLSLGAAASLFMVAAAPVAARWFGQPALTGLILLMAPLPLITSLGTVPAAAMQIDLRFRRLAVLTGVWNLTQLLLFILLAAMGLGAYGFVLSRLAGVGLYVAMLWRSAAPRIGRRAQVRRWRYMLGDSAVLTAALIVQCVVGQTDAFAVGVLLTAELAGLYFMALSLSLQTLQLVVFNVEALIFPALSKLQGDPVRQGQAFVRAARTMAAIVAPLCFLQAAVAEPLILLLLPQRWHGAIAAVQVLSVGMAFLGVSMPSGGMLLAQGRFAVRLKLAVVSLAACVPCVLLGCHAFGGIVGVAAGVTAYYVVGCFLSLGAALYPVAGWPRHLAGIVVVPVAASGAAVGAAWYLGEVLPLGPGGGWLRLPVVGAAAAAIYLPLLRLTMPGVWKEVWGLLDRLVLARLPGRRGLGAGEPVPTGVQQP